MVYCPKSPKGDEHDRDETKEQYVTMIQYYSQSVTKSVVGSVKKLRVLSKYLYLAPLEWSKGFFTLQPTHFFTYAQYSQVKTLHSLIKYWVVSQRKF